MLSSGNGSQWRRELERGWEGQVGLPKVKPSLLPTESGFFTGTGWGVQGGPYQFWKRQHWIGKKTLFRKNHSGESRQIGMGILTLGHKFQAFQLAGGVLLETRLCLPGISLLPASIKTII